MKYKNVMNKTVLNSTSEEMKKFFLEEDKYCAVRLPKYFEFHQLLRKVYDYVYSIDIESEEIKQILKKAQQIESTNYKLIVSKDGHYAWRKLEIIPPFLYVLLVRVLEKNWDYIKKRFVQFNKEKNNKVVCVSIPPLVPKQKKESYTKTTILNWSERVGKVWGKLKTRSNIAVSRFLEIKMDITAMAKRLFTGINMSKGME